MFAASSLRQRIVLALGSLVVVSCSRDAAAPADGTGGAQSSNGGAGASGTAGVGGQAGSGDAAGGSVAATGGVAGTTSAAGTSGGAGMVGVAGEGGAGAGGVADGGGAGTGTVAGMGGVGGLDEVAVACAASTAPCMPQPSCDSWCYTPDAAVTAGCDTMGMGGAGDGGVCMITTPSLPCVAADAPALHLYMGDAPHSGFQPYPSLHPIAGPFAVPGQDGRCCYATWQCIAGRPLLIDGPRVAPLVRSSNWGAPGPSALRPA